MTWILYVLTAIVCIAVVLRYFTWMLTRLDHSSYDHPEHTCHHRRSESEEHKEAVRLVLEGHHQNKGVGHKELLPRLRKQMDERGVSFVLEAEVLPVQLGALHAEWVCAPGVDTRRRVLYVHGGAYRVGSPKSHRLITSRLSQVSNAAVLAVDYRLMPEHSRMAGLEDCRQAYRWILEHGPEGQSCVDILIIAGDSSGGNMVLSLVAWARDSKYRAADAVVAFSPQTDLTLSSPSLVTNIDTDTMQGESFGPIVKAPKLFGWMFSFMMHKVRLTNPVFSPLLGDLSGLPPTLLQVSKEEMFLDDSIRYVNKANVHGSVAHVQIWPHMMHVWQAFEIPEAEQAFEEVGDFLERYTVTEKRL